MNVVDSCGWLEYIDDGDNADFFEAAILDTEHLIVPALTIFEVCKRIYAQRDEFWAVRTKEFMTRGRVIELGADSLLAAAMFSSKQKIAMADAIIWQTAHEHKATLLTQDIDLKGLPHVKYKAKK
jgi:toxin FitB